MVESTTRSTHGNDASSSEIPTFNCGGGHRSHCASTGSCSVFDDGGKPNTPPEPGVSGSAAAAGGSIAIQLTNFSELDPQTVGYGMWAMQMGLAEGLILQTPDGTDVRPALAEEWEVSDDGLVHTFMLREAKWSNGDPVTADDFVWSIQRLLDPNRGGGTAGTNGASSYQKSLGITNAVEFSTGQVTDFAEVGVKAVDERTLEFTLNGPNPGFVFGMAHPSMLPLHPASTEAGGWETPETFVTAGPYTLGSWVQNSSMRLDKNADYWDAANVALDTVNVELIEQGSVVTTVPFESGEVDIQELGQEADVQRFMDDPALAERISLVEDVRTSYLAPLMSENSVLQDDRVRYAISLALGREEAAGISRISNPASTLVSTQLPGWDKSIALEDPMWGDAAVKHAQELLAEAGFPNGEGFPQMTILAGADFPVIDVLVDRLQTNLNIKAVKDIVEVGVYVERRFQAHPEDYQGYWFGSFSGVTTWSNQVQGLWDANAVRQISLPVDAYKELQALQQNTEMGAGERNDAIQSLLATKSAPLAQEFAERVADVLETTDADEQQKILMDAASIREKGQFYIPVVYGSIVMISQERVEGFVARAQADRYYLKDLSVNDGK